MSLLLFLLAWVSAQAGTLTVEVLDVGQGDSILLQTPAGKNILIDGGTGRRNVAGILDRRGITSVDLVINTHAHADHLGGLDEVLEAMPVSVYIDPGMPHTTESYAKVVALIEQKNIRYKAVRGGQVFRFDDNIVMTVLAPYDPLLRGTRSDLNSNSVITRVDHGDVCFLFMGDAELETEHLVLEHGLEQCDILKVAHHGSAYATSPKFLEVVQPKWAAISVGRNNRYKHPAPDTVRRIEKSGATVLRTDLNGRILFESDGKSVEVSVAIDNEEHPRPEGVGHKPVRSMLPAAAGAEGGPTPPTASERARAQAEARHEHREPQAELSDREAFAASVRAQTPVPPPAAPTSGKWNINTATREQLVSISGIGPAKADAILRYRKEHGPFASLDAVDAVPGIGPALIKQLKQHAVAE
jgi:competence protein ComEC